MTFFFDQNCGRSALIFDQHLDTEQGGGGYRLAARHGGPVPTSVIPVGNHTAAFSLIRFLLVESPKLFHLICLWRFLNPLDI
ncbi:unnamed protein product [Cuscuta campestris]|uniref:Uncharacterized protein n=1 Tax=Cuscuta campestris TaxID=132261 RepID=A0A484KXK5_9ASTE|nr:unnamed protein product [Cuscuta campestris]